MRTQEPASVEVVEALITAWPEAVSICTDGSFPIHHAAQYESLEVIELLLKSWPAGIQARTAEQWQELALHVACYCGRSVSILECLVHAWPDGAMVIDKTGDTALRRLFNSSKPIPLASVKLIVEA